MKDFPERPFEYLKRKDGSAFSSVVITNWYKARAFVLDQLKVIAFKVDEAKHLHFVLKGDSGLMLSVARQIALSAHFLNYDEEKKDNRTKITIVSNAPHIEETLKEEEYLCNLLCMCKWTHGKVTHNKDSFIDIEINIVSNCDETESENVKVIEESEIILKQKLSKMQKQRVIYLQKSK